MIPFNKAKFTCFVLILTLSYVFYQLGISFFQVSWLNSGLGASKPVHAEALKNIVFLVIFGTCDVVHN